MQADPFDRIYQTYFDPVYRYSLSLSGNPQIAEEITQETFFRAMRSLDRFRGESTLKSWLCAIAKNLWLSERRRKASLPIDDAAPLPDPSMGPEEAIARQDESMRGHRLLHQLEEPYREVFMLRTFCDLSHAEIGSLFGRTENWSRVTYYRARQLLQRAMKEADEDEE